VCSWYVVEDSNGRCPELRRVASLDSTCGGDAVPIEWRQAATSSGERRAGPEAREVHHELTRSGTEPFGLH
jgi:hypothetical protein